MFFCWGHTYEPKKTITVDGRNPAPVDMVNIPLFVGFQTSQVVSRISAINSSIAVGRSAFLNSAFDKSGEVLGPFKPRDLPALKSQIPTSGKSSVIFGDRWKRYFEPPEGQMWVNVGIFRVFFVFRWFSWNFSQPAMWNKGLGMIRLKTRAMGQNPDVLCHWTTDCDPGSGIRKFQGEIIPMT